MARGRPVGYKVSEETKNKIKETRRKKREEREERERLLREEKEVPTGSDC